MSARYSNPASSSSGAVACFCSFVLLSLFAAPVHGTISLATVGCKTTDPNVSDSGAPHGLFVLFPFPMSPDYVAIQQYVLNSNLSCGANFYLTWASVDRGPGSSPRYDFSAMDALIQPWAAIGKTVNIDSWGVGYAAGANGTTPSYVLGQVNTVYCPTQTGGQTIPIYWQHGYLTNYESFIQAVVDHYQNDSDIGYLRFGIGVGGEDNPASDIGSPGCSSQLAAYGYSGPQWVNYTEQVIGFLGSLHSAKQLMVSMNLNPPHSQNTTSADAVAATAVPYGIGLGSQGLQTSDLTAGHQGSACSGDWCRNFALYQGRVPMELQTLYYSCPTGSCSTESTQTGSLVQLLPFALQGHTQIFELYWQDWLSALDPSYPTYTTTYLPALCSAAEVVGFAVTGVSCAQASTPVQGGSTLLGLPGLDGYVLISVIVAVVAVVVTVLLLRKRKGTKPTLPPVSVQPAGIQQLPTSTPVGAPP